MSSIKILFFTLFLASCSGESTKVDNQVKKEESTRAEPTRYTPNELQSLGIFIKDSSIIYNNVIDGVGSINIVIRNTEYSASIATTNETRFEFYPRYITTLDTVQRSVYMNAGDQKEAQKWQSFDNLVPIVVEQKVGEKSFGETLIFWMTKTPELEQALIDLDKRLR